MVFNSLQADFSKYIKTNSAQTQQAGAASDSQTNPFEATQGTNNANAANNQDGMQELSKKQNQEMINALLSEFDKYAEELTGGTQEIISLAQTLLNSMHVQITELQEVRDKAIAQMTAIEGKIDALVEDAVTKVVEAAKEREEVNVEYETQAQEVLQEKLQEYIEANKNGEQGMTRAELQENIKGAMPDAPDLSESMALLVVATDNMNMIDGYIDEVKSLMNVVSDIDKRIGNLQSKADDIQKNATKNVDKLTDSADSAVNSVASTGIEVGSQGDELASDVDNAIETGSQDLSQISNDAQSDVAMDTADAQGETQNAQNQVNVQDIKTHAQFVETYQEKAEETRTEITDEVSNYEKEGEYIEEFNEYLYEEAEKRADEYDELFRQMREGQAAMQSM